MSVLKWLRGIVFATSIIFLFAKVFVAHPDDLQKEMQLDFLWRGVLGGAVLALVFQIVISIWARRNQRRDAVQKCLDFTPLPPITQGQLPHRRGAASFFNIER